MKRCLDVGCGDNPHPDADVLCDLHVGRKRKYRPFVVADASHLPFRDKAFSRVNCVAVMEHTKNPRAILSELRRVAEHGYIETPSRFLEVLVGWKDHKWVIFRHGNRLYSQPPKRFCLGWVRLRSFEGFKRSEDEFMLPFGMLVRPVLARFLVKERVFKGRGKSVLPLLFTRYSF